MESYEALGLILRIAWPIFFLFATYAIGAYIERRHFASIRRREEQYRSFPVVTFETLPAGWQVTSASLVHGGIVVSLDYFKRFIAALRSLIGGRIRTYEPLLDRARREAMLRMIESARAAGYDAIVNARIETSRLANSRRDGKGTAGVEMFAFGTAVKLAKG